MCLALGCSNESAPPGLDPGPNIDAGDQADGSGNVDAPTGSDGGDAVGMPSSPFKSLETAANAPAIFSQSRAGVPLPGGAVAFIASLETLSDEERAASGARIGIWLQADKMSAPTVLYAGDKIVNPFDIDASFDGKTLYVADVAGGAEGRGAILSLSTGGGEPTELVSGFGPRGITVASDDRIYFTGIDEETGDAGLFLLAANSASKVFAGAPFVDPSGIAVRKDGSVLVADTRLSDGTSSAATALSKEAGIVLVKDGQASIFATGFSTGYPAGIALTTDEKALIISGQGPERSDTVYIVDVANPAAPPTVVTDKFSAYQDSSAGLKRAHDSNTFIWASLAANGGTVYRIVAN
jgi:DNA-binding beta-propeller fold protein YncE